MARATTTRCPTCGAKSPSEDERCRLYRTLPHLLSPAHRATRPTCTRRPSAAVNGAELMSSSALLLVVAVLGLGTWNYLALGYGPAVVG